MKKTISFIALAAVLAALIVASPADPRPFARTNGEATTTGATGAAGDTPAEEPKTTPEEDEKAFIAALQKVRKLSRTIESPLAEVELLETKLKKDKPAFGKAGADRFKLFREDALLVSETQSSLKTLLEDTTYLSAIDELQKAVDKFKGQRKQGPLLDEAYDYLARGKQFKETVGDEGVKKALTSFADSGKQLAIDLAAELKKAKIPSLTGEPEIAEILSALESDIAILDLHLGKYLDLYKAHELVSKVELLKPFNEHFIASEGGGKLIDVADSILKSDKLPKVFTRLAAANAEALKDGQEIVSRLVSGQDVNNFGFIGLSKAKAHADKLMKIQKPLLELGDRLAGVERYSQIRAEITSFAQGLYGFQLVLNSILNLADPGLATDMSGYVHDQIRLFYFAEVGRLMRTLNPHVETKNPSDRDLAKIASGKREELLTAQNDVAINQHRMLQLRREQAAIQAKVDATTRKAEAADNRYLSERKRKDSANENLAKRKDEKTKLEEELEKATTEEDKTRLTKEIEDKDREIATAEKELELRTNVTDTADEDAKRAGAERDRLRNRESKLPEELENAKAAADAAQEALMTARNSIRGAGQAELEAFAEMRDNAPFLVSRPIPGSTDPIHKVLLYGYPNSNTLFIRGAGPDVRVAKEIIAGFDAPAPQAKINLYTLQINGTSNAKLDKTIADVNKELRELSSNISMLEDDLRFSLTSEVKRVSTVAQRALADGGLAISDARLLRYFYYPQEIRRRLGCKMTIPTERRLFESAKYDLALAIRDLAAADAIPIRTDSGYLKSRSKKQKEEDDLRVSRKYSLYESAAAYVGYATTALEDVTSIVNNSRAANVVLPLELKNFGAATNPLQSLQTATQAFIAYQEQKSTSLPSDSSTIRSQLKAIVDLKASSFIPTSVPYLTVDNGLNSTTQLTKWTLPDPSNGTTLGEMILNITLGRKTSRQRIIDDFLRRATTRHTAAAKERISKTDKDYARELRSESALERFVEAVRSASTSGVSASGTLPGFPGSLLGSDPGGSSVDDAELSSNQLEVLLALETKARETAASEVRWLIRQMYDSEEYQGFTARETLRKDYKLLLGWLAESFQAVGQTRRIIWQHDLQDVRVVGQDEEIFELVPGSGTSDVQNMGLGLLPKGQAQTYEQLADKLLLSEERLGNVASAATQLTLDRRAWQFATMMASRNALARSTPRVAAADHMLHNLLSTVERDLDKFFIQDAFDQIRQAIRENGVQFGALEHESILATNRLIARVDPNANADFELAQGTDFVQAATQLGYFLGIPKDALNSGATAAALGATAGALEGGPDALNPWSIGGLLGALNFLNDSQPDQRGDVYSINSGNLFKVTPVFGPSGQAMRFRFDYQATTHIQEPNGTTNRAIPQVNRHAVNTEVQLNNLRFGEISRFGLNAKMGTPDERRGGIPLIKDLPVIRDIPLLGYFFRRRGTDAVRQESLIFAQTTMYPTISDIVNLVVNKSPHDDLMEPAPAGLFPEKVKGEKK